MAALWAAQHATPGGAPAGLSVATRKAPALTPAGVLDFHAHGAFATPLDESDDTPRSADAGAGWASGSGGGSPERAEVRRAPTAGACLRDAAACAVATRADASAGRWRARGAQMGEDDEFELEPGELAFQFGAAAAHEHYSASGLRAALAAGTPAPGGGAFSPPPPPAPRKGPTSFPSRVQARGSRRGGCRSPRAVAAVQLR